MRDVADDWPEFWEQVVDPRESSFVDRSNFVVIRCDAPDVVICADLPALRQNLETLDVLDCDCSAWDVAGRVLVLSVSAEDLLLVERTDRFDRDGLRRALSQQLNEILSRRGEPPLDQSMSQDLDWLVDASIEELGVTVFRRAAAKLSKTERRVFAAVGASLLLFVMASLLGYGFSALWLSVMFVAVAVPLGVALTVGRSKMYEQ